MAELRWSAPSEGGLFELTRRVPGRGRYRGQVFHEIEAKSILNRVPGDFLPFDWTINPYRGCSHACVYCFARPTHEYLGLDTGKDFDTQIVVKINAVELTRAETSPARWSGESIAMGTNTDPYQSAEGRYRLTRGILEVLVERGNPFTVLTKSTLALRDIDLFSEAARTGRVTVSFSIGTLDPEVWKQTEPGTPHPLRRVEAISRLSEAGVPTGVLIAPVIPGLSDRPEQIAEVEAVCREAGAGSVYPIRLHLRPGVKQHFTRWLAETHPELTETYEKLYRDRAYLPRHPKGRHKPQPRPKPQPQPTLPFG